MTETTGRFDLTSWDEDVYDDAEGAKLVRVRSTKSFEGGMVGTSAVEILQALAQEGGVELPGRAYVAIERVTAEVDGRKGTFVLTHSAVGSASGGSFRVEVVPHSATGDLTGLRGEMSIDRSPEGEHTYSFRYELE